MTHGYFRKQFFFFNSLVNICTKATNMNATIYQGLGDNLCANEDYSYLCIIVVV